MDLKFSVLMAVYFKENPIFLSIGMESIWNYQTIKPDQIILICDGKLGKDLIEEIEQLKSKIPVLEVYGYKENKGLGFALNFGLKKCNFELVFRMDSDDLAHPMRFEIQLKHFQSESDISIIGTDIQEFIDIPGDINKLRTVPISANSINLFKKKRNPFNHMTVLFKKSIVQKVGGYKEMSGYEDYYLWMRLLKEHKGKNLSQSLVFARIGNNMMERRQGFEFLKKEIRFQNRLLYDKLIPYSIYVRNIFIRALPRILPVFILNIIYTKYLRNRF